MSIQIIRPGLLATVQDLGRYKYQKYGVVVGGAMDTSAARTANLLVGNNEAEAVLELTLAGAEFCVTKPALIAVCGGDMAAEVNGKRLPLWRPVLVDGGSVVQLREYRSGCRTYVAVGGGFDLPKVMGSRSTYVRGGIGGYNGRALSGGDTLSIRPPLPRSLSARIIASMHSNGMAAPAWHAGHFAVAGISKEPVVRIVPGSHYEQFTPESRQGLLQASFRVGTQSDRMGCRLEGRTLQLSSPMELITEAVANGTIQVPLDGKPIVLLADRQTTGGYPRMAQVASVDLSVFAQLKPGDSLRFTLISQREAERLLIAEEHDMRLLKAAIELKFPPVAAIASSL